MSTSKDILEILTELRDVQRAKYKAYRVRVTNRAIELNSGWSATLSGRKSFDKCVDPTWGVDGRPHAPFDGYLWEDPITQEIEAYGGGQYLPYADEADYISRPISESPYGFWKLRITEEMYNSLCMMKESIDILPPYKTWVNEDINVFMCEIKTNPIFLDAIKTFSDAFFTNLYEQLKLLKGGAPSGKTHVKGILRSTKVVESFYGPSIKMTVVLENGSTVYGSLPKSVSIDYRGEIEFTATFEVAENDKTHAFFKRPSQIKVI